MRKIDSDTFKDDEIGAKYGYAPDDNDLDKSDLYSSAACSAVSYATSAFLVGYGIYALAKKDPNVLSSLCCLFMSVPVAAIGSAELALSLDAAEKLRNQKNEQNDEIEQ